VVQDRSTRRGWDVLHLAIIPKPSSAQPHVKPIRPPRTQHGEFFIGDTLGFTDKHLNGRRSRRDAECQDRVGRRNDADGHWRISPSLLEGIVDI